MTDIFVHYCVPDDSSGKNTTRWIQNNVYFLQCIAFVQCKVANYFENDVSFALGQDMLLSKLSSVL